MLTADEMRKVSAALANLNARMADLYRDIADLQAVEAEKVNAS